MNSGKGVKEVFDDIASEWAEYRGEPRPWLKHFLSFLKREWIVLDAGCGNANNAVEIAERVKRVFATDFSPKMLVEAGKLLAKKKINNAELAEADVLRLPFENAFFDAALYSAVLHHLTAAQAKKAVKEANRVLKPGGLLFATAWSRKKPGATGKQGREGFVAWKTRKGTALKRFHSFFSPTEFACFFKQNGFRVMRLFFVRKDGVECVESEADNVCVIAVKK